MQQQNLLHKGNKQELGWDIALLEAVFDGDMFWHFVITKKLFITSHHHERRKIYSETYLDTQIYAEASGLPMAGSAGIHPSPQSQVETFAHFEAGQG